MWLWADEVAPCRRLGVRPEKLLKSRLMWAWSA